MRDVLDELVGWWQAGRDRRHGHGGRPPGAPRPGRPARRCWSARTGRRSAASPAAASRARSTRWRTDAVETGEPDAAALRRQRRRRVRGRADLRRHHRPLRRAGRPASRSPSWARSRSPSTGTSRSPSSPASQGRDDRLGRRLVRLARPRARAPSARSGWTTPCADDARGMLAAGRTGMLHYRPRRRAARRRPGAVRATPSPRRPRMLVFGAIDFAAAVARVGAFLGYRVTVCDARPVFATPKRFPEADEVVVDWPHRYLQAEVDAGRVDGRTVRLRAHPRPEVRRAAAGGRAAAAGRLRRRDGLPAHPRRPAWSGCARPG